jgi:hypothetical protein
VIADLPAGVAALGASHANMLGFVFGRLALVSPLSLQLPILVPSFPVRYRMGRPFRLLLGAWAAASVLLFVVEFPRALHATIEFGRLEGTRVETRAAEEFAIGVRILPRLVGLPPATALRQDQAILDSLGVDAVAVLIAPSGVTRRALDSLSRALDLHRRDSALVVATLGYSGADREAFARDPAGWLRSRVRLVDSVARYLRPDVFFPASDPSTAGVAALGDVPSAFWRTYFLEAASVAHQLLPRIQVGLTISSYTAPDSELYAWASAPSTELDVIGLALHPSYGGGASLATRFHVAERWMRAARKPHWVFASGAYPRLYGERNQERALQATLAWATRQPSVRGFIVEGAGDYEMQTGLRAPGDRLRAALFRLMTTKRAMEEAR